MRSHEFITETITIADYQEQFKKVIAASIKVALIKLSDDRGIYKQAEEKANQTDSIRPLITEYMLRFWNHLHDASRDNLSEIVAKFFNQRYKNDQSLIDTYRSLDRAVIFESIPHRGYVVGLLIILSDEFISDIDNDIGYFIQNNYLDLIDYNESGTTTDKFFKTIEILANHPDDILTNSKIINIIFSMSKTITHELVHVFQHAEQYKKDRRYNLEYRSYAEKDKEKFYDAIRRLGYDASPEVFKLYLASPQEITAIAHNIVIQLIKDFDLNQNPDYIDQDQYNNIVSNYVLDHLKYTPEQRRNMNYIERKVFNRYAKQVYQILQHYIETEREKFYNDLSFQK